MADIAIFDVDGTLIDSNYQHALSWYRAFRRFDVTPPIWRLHRAVGKGGEFLVPDVAGDDVEREHGDAIRDAQVDEFDALIDEVRPFEGAHALLQEVHGRGFDVVLASSGKTQHIEMFLDLLDARDLADAWTTSDDAEQSKPAPDIVQVAMSKVGGSTGVMIGDSTWDVVAAAKLDIASIAVLTGGYGEDELREAGAIAVYTSLVALREHLDETPLAKAAS